MLNRFHINIPFLEAIDQVPSYAKFLKDIVTKKRKVESYETIVVASEYCAGRIDLPMKKKEKCSFIIPCFIGNNFVGNALCDLGSRVNLMPKAVFKKIGIGIERPTTVILQLADRSYVRPEGKVEDVIVKENTATSEDPDIICCSKFIHMKDFEKLKKEDAEELDETPCETHHISYFTIRTEKVESSHEEGGYEEIIKWLDAGVIYLISDSSWVSLVQCVPKKRGITVVTNEENELFPTRTVTGWRICMDYRKLNKATKKDHFSLHFIDQMLD
ncbi:hypothetical protein GQ457_01G025420 [Hibiscus cannabinus]